MTPEPVEVFATKRPTVPAMEAMMGQTFNILDHGFVRAVDYMGSDASIVQAARVSYGSGTKTVSQDEALIRYMMRHKHTSPFEMPSIVIHAKMPIFVARQWIRHRMASVNEYSARYSILDREFYIPEPEHLAVQSTANKQGRGEVLSARDAQVVVDILKEDSGRNYDHYEYMLNENQAYVARPGLARELARMNLTLNTYTQWYWKTDLHNLFGFLSQRADAHAQYEIRVYADKLLEIAEAWVPMAARAFRDYRLEAVTLSAGMLDVVRRRFYNGQHMTKPDDMSKREWDEFLTALEL